MEAAREVELVTEAEAPGQRFVRESFLVDEFARFFENDPVVELCGPTLAALFICNRLASIPAKQLLSSKSAAPAPLSAGRFPSVLQAWLASGRGGDKVASEI